MSRKLVYFDTETGGLMPGRHPLLSVALHHPQIHQETQAWEVCVDPGHLEIDPRAAAVNGWPEAFADKELLSPRLAAEMIRERLDAWKPDYLVGHNAAFDYSFLKQLIGAEAMPRVLCTQTLAETLRALGGINTQTRLSLDALLKELAPEALERRGASHSASVDAWLTRVVWERLQDAFQGMASMAQKASLGLHRPPPAVHRFGRLVRWGHGK